MSTLLHDHDPARELTPDARSEPARALLHSIVVTPRTAEAPARPIRRLRPLLIGTGLAGAVAAAAVALTWSGGEPAHAPSARAAGFRVTTDQDGSVDVRVDVRQLRDPAALQRALDQSGVRAVVLHLPPGGPSDRPCAQHTSAAITPDKVEIASQVPANEPTIAMVIHPDRFGADETLTILVGRPQVLEHRVSGVAYGVGLVTGKVPTCG
jgi:hypothetical protein